MTFVHHVFLSYSRKDTAMMIRVRDDLRASGLIVWTDEHLEAGTPSWTRDIDQAIRNTGCLVVLLSPDAYNSEWVGREIAFSQTHNKRIFPMLVRGDTTNAVPFDLARHNFVDIRTNYDTGMQKTIRDIRKHLNIPEPIKPPPQESKPVVQAISTPPKPLQQISESPKPTQPQSVMPQKVEAPKPQVSSQPVSEPPKTQQQAQSVDYDYDPYAIKKSLQTLKAYNPLDWAKLLWWILLDPKQWVQYRQAQGKTTYIRIVDEPTGAWLISTLTWLPLFWLTLGITINTLPLINSSNEFVRYIVFIILILWLLTIFLNIRTDGNLLVIGVISGVLVGFIIFLLLSNVLFGVVGALSLGISFAFAIGLPFIFAFIVSGGVGGRPDLRPSVAYGVAYGGVGVIMGIFAFGFAFMIAGMLAGGAAFIVVFIASFVMMNRIVSHMVDEIETAIKIHSAIRTTRSMFIALIASHIFLIWYCLLGGYHVLN